MGTSRPTVYDVAERAGVSIATVSFAFRRPEKVREETRRTILRVASEIGYVPSGTARNLARGRTGVLGLHLFDMLLDSAPDGTTKERDEAEELIDLATLDLESGRVDWQEQEDARRSDPRVFPLYVDEIQRGFVLECKRNGTAVLLNRGGPDTSGIAETAGQVDGLAILPTRSALASLDAVTSTLPLVMLSSRGGAGHRVLADNARGEQLLVEHLVAGHGVRELGWIGDRSELDPRERMDAFFESVAACGPGVHAEALDRVDLEQVPTFELVRARIAEGTLPQALVCATDQIAIALLDVLHEHGVSVPGDVLVAGFDGIQAARLSRPSLTTVRQPMELMGRIAAHLLLTDPRDGSAPHRCVTVDVALRLGGSCGCVPR